MSDRVRIYEVGPRDGLQNESVVLPIEAKLRYIELLLAAGLREIEATSFVSPKAIPQLADADALMAGLRATAAALAASAASTVLTAPTALAASAAPTALTAPTAPPARFPVLVPNMRGMERAEAAGAQALAVFTAATDAFTERNIGMTVDASLEAFAPVLQRAKSLGWWRRGYVSTAFGCPYTGAVTATRAVDVALRLLDLGLDEVCFGDTIGVGVPSQVAVLTGTAVAAGIPLERIAFHFHDTRGTALANVSAGLDAGVRCFDSAAGGTGGCPYAPGAAGNLATEDLVYFLDASGWEHGADLGGVLAAARFAADALGKPLTTKVGQAGGWDASTGAPSARA